MFEKNNENVIEQLNEQITYEKKTLSKIMAGKQEYPDISHLGTEHQLKA